MLHEVTVDMTPNLFIARDAIDRVSLRTVQSQTDEVNGLILFFPPALGEWKAWRRG